MSNFKKQKYFQQWNLLLRIRAWFYPAKGHPMKYPRESSKLASLLDNAPNYHYSCWRCVIQKRFWGKIPPTSLYIRYWSMAQTVGTCGFKSWDKELRCLQAFAQINLVLPTALSPTKTHLTNSWFVLSSSMIIAAAPNIERLFFLIHSFIQGGALWYEFRFSSYLKTKKYATLVFVLYVVQSSCRLPLKKKCLARAIYSCDLPISKISTILLVLESNSRGNLFIFYY